MRRRLASLRVVPVAAAALLSFVALAAPARAAPEPPNDAFHHVGVTTNLLGPLNDTYQASIEGVVDPRWSFTVAPWIASGRATGGERAFEFWGDFSVYTVKFDAVGIDTQVRRYVGPWRGASGPFVAVGLDGSRFRLKGDGCRYPLLGERSAPPCDNGRESRITYVGPTADMGAQLVLPVGFTVGGSIGLRYRFVPDGDIHALTLPSTFDAAHGPGFGLRLRAFIGWSFL